MRALLLAATLMLAIPAASADHWVDDYSAYPGVGDSTCSATSTSPDCTLAYLCIGDAPPQVVDLALYCALRASGEAQDIAEWVPVYVWEAGVDEYSDYAEGLVDTPHDATINEVNSLNLILCSQIWSFFCTNPVVLPEHIPVEDPVNDYPL